MSEFQGATKSPRRSRLQSIERYESLSAEQVAALEAATQRYESRRVVTVEPRASELDSTSRPTSEKEEP